MSESYDEGTERLPQDDDRDAASGLRRRGHSDEPDVLLDVSELRVDEITLEVEDLTAHVPLEANVLDLLKLHVGVDATLGGVKLTIKGVEAKVLLKVRLDNVARIIDRVFDTIDNNPEIIGQLLGGSARRRPSSTLAPARWLMSSPPTRAQPSEPAAGRRKPLSLRPRWGAGTTALVASPGKADAARRGTNGGRRDRRKCRRRRAVLPVGAGGPGHLPRHRRA